MLALLSAQRILYPIVLCSLLYVCKIETFENVRLIRHIDYRQINFGELCNRIFRFSAIVIATNAQGVIQSLCELSRIEIFDLFRQSYRI